MPIWAHQIRAIASIKVATAGKAARVGMMTGADEVSQVYHHTAFKFSRVLIVGDPEITNRHGRFSVFHTERLAGFQNRQRTSNRQAADRASEDNGVLQSTAY